MISNILSKTYRLKESPINLGYFCPSESQSNVLNILCSRFNEYTHISLTNIMLAVQILFQDHSFPFGYGMYTLSLQSAKHAPLLWHRIEIHSANTAYITCTWETISILPASHPLKFLLLPPFQNNWPHSRFLCFKKIERFWFSHLFVTA